MTKHVFTVLTLMLCIQQVFAQTEKGRFAVGGGVDINAVRQSDRRNFNMSIAPSFGVFVVKNLVVGGRYSFGVNGSRRFNENRNKYEITNIFTSGIGPFVKYYVGKSAARWFITANGSYQVYTWVRGGNVRNLNGFSTGGSTGLAYFINNYIAIETGMYAQVSGYEGEYPTTRIGFSVGFSVLLDKKKKEETLNGPNAE